MLPYADRLVDLIGPRASSNSPIDDITAALARCDTAALSAVDGHFAAVSRDGRTVRLARTIGLPLRYFVAKMNHGPFLVVADRMDRIFDWCQEQRIGWQFDPSYTRMVPAHYVVELDQVGCPDPAPRYHRFFNPSIGHGSADLAVAGADYIQAAYDATRTWIGRVPRDQAIGVEFSGGVDSTAILLLARRACEALGRNPADVRAFTLDLGNGEDAAQAEATVRALGIDAGWERVQAEPDAYDPGAAVSVIEDYHPLDVECAAASLALLRAVRERHPSLTYLLDGDGGDENLKSYPLEDSDLTLSSVLRNPLLYQEGWGVDAIKHSEVYSGGLSRGYVRSYAPAATLGFNAFSPFTERRVIAAAAAIPFEQVVDGRAERLGTIKADVVRAGIRSVLGIDMPVHPKRRFQDGVSGAPRARVSKAWCRTAFDRIWEDRLRDTPDLKDDLKDDLKGDLKDAALDRRSGNEVADFSDHRQLDPRAAAT
jgi:asparagine synthase (glutamine-hydrolysing)